MNWGLVLGSLGVAIFAAACITTAESKREAIARIAQEYVGTGELREFYDSACLPSNYSGEWCGIFALAVLHEAGVALDVCWKIGSGFLSQLPIVKTPQIGDIGYKDAPWQHHAIVIAYDYETNSFLGVDGNGKGGVVSEGWRSATGYTFYSIEKWV